MKVKIRFLPPESAQGKKQKREKETLENVVFNFSKFCMVFSLNYNFAQKKSERITTIVLSCDFMEIKNKENVPCGNPQEASKGEKKR